MAPRPRLVPSGATRGSDVDLPSTPFWIGAAADSGLRLLLPGMTARHVSILEREDGFWISPARPEASPRVNGDPAPAPRRLRHGDLLEFAPGVVYRFDSGEAVPAAAAPRVRPPPVLAPPAAARERQGGLVDRRTRRRRWLWRGAVAAALALVVVAVIVAVQALRRDAPVQAPLSEADAVYLDSLMLNSSERVERGTALLGLGLADEALREFARAVNQLETSRLGGNEWVRPRIATLEGAIAAVYRERRIAVPPAYQAARPAPSASASRAGLPKGALTPEQFAAAVEDAQREFQARYGRRIIITGRDHGEHMMLYGPGGALDMRVRDLTREQLVFGMDALRRRGVRVKDFSDDRVLQAQIESARRRNRPDLMGTGLHLHIDRFANRWDRWTTHR